MWTDVDKRQHSLDVPVNLAPHNYSIHIYFISAVSYDRGQNVIDCLWHNFKHIVFNSAYSSEHLLKSFDPKLQVLPKSNPVLCQSFGGELFFFPREMVLPCSLYQHLMCWNPRVFLREIIVFSSQLAAPGPPKINRGLLCDPCTQKTRKKKKKSPFVPYSLFLMADSSYCPMTQISFPSFTSGFALTNSSCLGCLSFILTLYFLLLWSLVNSLYRSFSLLCSNNYQSFIIFQSNIPLIWGTLFSRCIEWISH